MSPHSTLSPHSTSERIELLDVLRGFAIMGILVANILVFSGYLFTAMAGDTIDSPYPALDHIATFLIHFAVHGKFYSLFALLFGIGFALQSVRARASGRPVGPFFRRRMIFLLLFGAVHTAVWAGDILALYAMIGFLLIAFDRLSDRALMISAVALLAMPVLWYGLLVVVMTAAGPDAARGDAVDRLFRFMQKAFSEGTYTEVFEANWTFLLYGRLPQLVLTGRFFNILAMFLVGLTVGRLQLFRDPNRLAPYLLPLLLLGFVGNLSLAVFMETDVFFSFRPLGIVQSVSYQIGVPALCLLYAVGISSLFQHATWRRRLEIFAPLGRMALTNYLVQTFICIPFFYGIGLGFYGRVGAAASSLLAFGIVLAQAFASRWWLERFRYGPFEWLWRSLTYGRMQPMRS